MCAFTPAVVYRRRTNGEPCVPGGRGALVCKSGERFRWREPRPPPQTAGVCLLSPVEMSPLLSAASAAIDPPLTLCQSEHRAMPPPPPPRKEAAVDSRLYTRTDGCLLFGSDDRGGHRRRPHLPKSFAFPSHGCLPPVCAALQVSFPSSVPLYSIFDVHSRRRVTAVVPSNFLTVLPFLFLPSISSIFQGPSHA